MRQTGGSLDPLDYKILQELQTDSRLSMRELGRRVGLSAPAVTERVKRLEDAQIILGYGVRVASKPLGRTITAFIGVKDSGRNDPTLVRWASQRSYGMYVVHLSVMEFARRLMLDGVLQPREGVLLAGLATAVLAELSYRLVEVPLLVRRPPQHARADRGHRNRRGMRVIAF